MSGNRHDNGDDGNNEDIDDISLFRQALRAAGVTPIRHNRADTGRPVHTQRDRDTLDARRQAAITASSDTPSSRTSDGRVDPVRPSESLFFALPDLPYRTVQQLKRGDIEWQSGLDLHGYTIDEARLQLETFLHEARAERIRCVLVVHGKAWTTMASDPLSQNRYPVIKSHVNAWLRELPEVLAFCSATPNDGGTGAVYVLLRRTR
ncbi:Smr/MutS family protein [Phytohalomonas tamaricis]|uniref:Smr/MutS family protein n=1 Tax=Phytohalomonas tamaricis TaxID=2081032 RepID=UPI000D0B6A5C|nr:Smr/MutS family protein [Phytohalomonas tamaricis]